MGGAFFLSLVELPWYVKSPSPWTVVFWSLLVAYGYFHYSGYKDTAKRKIVALADVGLILAFLVLVQDSFFCIGQQVRFGYLYPGDYSAVLSLARNVLGMVFIYPFSVGPAQRSGLIHLGFFHGYYFFVMALCSAVNFAVAPDPGWTDWTWAIQHGLSFKRVLDAFLISHVGFKALFVPFFVEAFRK